jgi:hypothetical protein
MHISYFFLYFLVSIMFDKYRIYKVEDCEIGIVNYSSFNNTHT